MHDEESLLKETASREAQLTETISDLEAELKHTKQEMDHLCSENDRLSVLSADVTQQVLNT